MSIVGNGSIGSPSGSGGGINLSTDGTILNWNIGWGVAGAYTPDVGDAEYAADGVSMSTVIGTWQRDGNGYLYNTASGNRFYIDLPAKTTEIRRYILTMYGNGGVTPARWQFNVNYVDSTHHWYGRLMSATSSTRWSTELYEYNGTETQRDVEATIGAVGHPTYFNVVIDDHGDLLTYGVQATKKTPASVSDHHISILEYYQASRTSASTQKFGIYALDGSNFLYLSSLKIVDVPTI